MLKKCVVILLWLGCYFFFNDAIGEPISSLMARAQAGQAAAQYQLGSDYYHGKGVAKNQARALFWYRHAARQGNGAAMDKIGNAYLNGVGVTKDYAKARQWFMRGARSLSDLATRSISS